MRYVYRLLNVINNKVYIGQTKNPAVRKANHICAARKGVTTGLLYAAMRKHGIENFVFEIIEECEDHLIDEREKYWVSHYDSYNWDKGYNATRGGQGTQGYDLPKSSTHREHMRESQKRHWASSPDAEARKQQLVERNKSEEASQLSAAAQNRRWSKWHAENPPQPKQLLSKEEKSRRISERMTGKKRGSYKNRGIERGPVQTSHACKVCGQTMKYMTHTHLIKHDMTREQYATLP